MALGSGFIIDPRGYIVTNNHVVANAEKVTVIFQDHSQHPAKVVGRDQRTDLALLKIKTDKPLPYVSWGDSDNAKVGDWVVAVGNPFGLGGTVTAGIISALGRNINEGPYDDFLQIDAPINRGNSGGPTFDLAGQVVGINTAIYSPSGGSVGIGFAIPSNLAKYVVGELEAHGSVTWGWLGVAIQNISPVDRQEPRPQPGAAGRRARRLGRRRQSGGQGRPQIGRRDPQRRRSSDPRRARPAAPGCRDAGRKNAQRCRSCATASPRRSPRQSARCRPSSPRREGNETQPSAAPTSALGMELAPLGPDLRRQLKIANDVNGVVVTRVAADSPVASMGVQAGDVIQSVDQKPVTTPQQAAASLKEAAKSGNILLLINRHGASEFVGLSVESSTGNSG